MSTPKATYDGNWLLTLNNFTGFADNDKGLFLGNGKIGLVTDLNSPDVKQMMITTDLKYSNGLYKANITDPFYIDNVKFFDNKNPANNIVRTMTQQQLNMYSGIFTSTYTVNNTTTTETINVESDIFVPQQLPFCVMNTIRVTPQQDMTELNFFHEVYANSNLTNVEYNNNVIFNESISSTQGQYILSGKATINQNPDDTMACASIYVIETDNQNLGFNIFRGDLSRAYNKFKLTNLVAGTTYRFHIISAIISSFDFTSPLEECKRIVLNIANKTTPALQVRTDHTNIWQQLWQTDISIAPKTGITTTEATDLAAVKQSTRYSLFKLYCSVRENINIEVNPLNLSVIDYDGNILYNGDLWLIPLLTLIKPDIARALLEYRYKALEVARQLAAGYGYKGAKFPYINDTLGYKNALYWDTVGPMTIFNTALISVNVWNYYRVVKDRDWLINKGYAILKDIADFFSSIAVKDSDGTWHLRNVISLNGTISTDNNSFTNNMAKLALKYAIEASYELGYYVKDDWYNAFYGLPTLILPDPDYPVIQYDAIADASITLNIVEPWFVLVPYYSQLFYSTSTPQITVQTAVLKNLNYYSPKIVTDYVSHPFNVGLQALLYALYAQYDSNYVNNFCTYLNQFVQKTNAGVWGTDDVVICGIELFFLLQGAMQFTVYGGVAQTKFYYEEFRLANQFAANLPNTWKSISITVGKTYTTTNKLYYTGTPCV